MSITLEQAKEKLRKYGQEHVLKYYEELSQAEKAALLEQIETSDMYVLDSCRHQEELLKRGVITPLAAARWAAALTASLLSSIHPVIHSTPKLSAIPQIFSAS